LRLGATGNSAGNTPDPQNTAWVTLGEQPSSNGEITLFTSKGELDKARAQVQPAAEPVDLLDRESE
jgi:hypothetical protein